MILGLDSVSDKLPFSEYTNPEGKQPRNGKEKSRKRWSDKNGKAERKATQTPAHDKVTKTRTHKHNVTQADTHQLWATPAHKRHMHQQRQALSTRRRLRTPNSHPNIQTSKHPNTCTFTQHTAQTPQSCKRAAPYKPRKHMHKCTPLPWQPRGSRTTVEFDWPHTLTRHTTSSVSRLAVVGCIEGSTPPWSSSGRPPPS